MKRALTFGLAALALALLAWAGWHYGWLSGALGIGRPDQGGAAVPGGAGPPPQTPDQRGVAALGRLEPAAGLVDIAALPGDRIETIPVKEGQPVRKGDPLVLLSSRTLREKELDAAESQLQEAQARANAEATLADVRITAAGLALEKAQTADLDIRAQTKKLEVSRANLALVEKDQARLAGLREGFVSQQERDRQDLLVEQARAAVEADEAMLEKLNRTKDLGVRAAEADLKAAKATKDQVLAAIPVASLRAQRDLVREQFERTALCAPCDGTVLKIYMRPGETIGQRPVLQMADLSSMVVVAEVYETDARRVEPGQAAAVKSRAFPEPYDDDEKGLRGRVESKAKMITRPALQSLDPLAASDRRVVEVRIRLDEAGSRLAAGLSNLQVDVTIEARGP